MIADKIFSKIKNRNYIYIILIIGAAFMLLFPGTEKKSAVEQEEVKISEETRLEKILSEMEGVGEVSVMITYYASSEKALAYETKISRKSDTTGISDAESSDEKAVMSDGEPVVLREVYPEVKGVVVIAEGAANVKVKKAICEAVSTALGIAMHKICVLPGIQNKG